jgi:hypothetical protein
MKIFVSHVNIHKGQSQVKGSNNQIAKMTSFLNDSQLCPATVMLFQLVHAKSDHCNRDGGYTFAQSTDFILFHC